MLLPPCIVIALASLTGRIRFALMFGIFSAGLVLHDFDLVLAVTTSCKRIFEVSELGLLVSWQSFWAGSNLFIMLFLFLLGILMAIIQHSGGAYAYATLMSKRLKTKAQVEGATIGMALVFFIDDYFNILTVGSVMRSLTDRFKVPRVKLGFLINAIAAPLAVIVPVSSWVVEIVGQLRNSGISMQQTHHTLLVADPFSMFLSMIPYQLYSLITIATLAIMVWAGWSFGVIAHHEKIAQKGENLFGGKTPVSERVQVLSEAKKAQCSLADFIVGLAVLITSVFGLILLFGNHWAAGGDNDIFGALKQANIYAAFFFGGLCAVLTSFAFSTARSKLALSDTFLLIKEGIDVMGSSIATLLLMWTLSGMLSRELQTGSYIASMMSGSMTVAYMPVLFFLVAVGMSSLMASAWGTIGMLVPLVLPMFGSLLNLVPPFALTDLSFLPLVLASIVSGALVGNHMSPVADVMLMSALSAGSYHWDLVKTQMMFAFPAMLSTAVAFLVAGLLFEQYGAPLTLLASLSVGFLLNVACLYGMHRNAQGKRA